MARAKKAGAERTAYLAQLAQLAPNVELGHLYGLAMSAVAKKSVVRLHPDTKARFCKKCFVPKTLETTDWSKLDTSKLKNRPMMLSRCRCGAQKYRPLFDKPKKK